MLAKFDGRCTCGNRFTAGTSITYDRNLRKVTGCPSCSGASRSSTEPETNGGVELSGESLDSILPETATTNYLALMARLDPQQRAVASWTPADGNARVVAAAGSGKTTTSVALLAALVRGNLVAPGRIVATTFTSKAGKELIERLVQVLPPGTISETPNGSKDQLRAGTFHSIALRALRHAEPNVWRLGKCIDLPEKSRDKGIPSAAILWHRVLGWGEIPGLPNDVKGLDMEEPDVKAYQLAVDVCRSTGASGDALAQLVAEAEMAQGLRGLTRAYTLVVRAKAALGAFDFADALQAYYEGLKHGTIRDSADVVLVDEAQDNSKVQLEIAKLLSKNGRLILVGDVRQSIYSWRGAYPDMFLHADTEIGATTYELPTNYRSVGTVVALGNAIAAGKAWALGAAAKAARPEQGTVEVKGYTDPAEEAEQTARTIQAAMDEGSEASDFAILTRTNAAAGAYEAALVARKIPCVVVGGTPFFDRKEVKDALAYYRLSAHDDIEALTRICNKPRRFLGKAFIAAVRSRAEGGDRSLADVIAQVAPTLRDASRDGAEELAATLHTLRNMEWAVIPSTIAGLLAAPEVENKAGEADEDRSGIPVALAAIAQDFPSAEALCSFATRCASEVKGVSEEMGKLEGRVTISTIHKAKGLEWKHVFVGCTKGSFPHARASNVDEETRLFYVAATRAKDVLTLTHCGLDLRGKVAGASGFLDYVPKKEVPPEPPQGPTGGGEPVEREDDEDGDEGPKFDDAPHDDNVLRYDDEGYDQHGAPHPEYDAARRAFVEVTPAISNNEARGLGMEYRLKNARAYAQARTDREARAVAGPGGRYVQATREDFEELLRPIGFIPASSDVARRAHEHVFELGLPDKADKGYIAIRVFSSVALGEADARELGEDAIRVAALYVPDWEGHSPVPLRKKMQRVFRTRSWRLNLLERIEAVMAEIEKAPACPRCGAPMAERTAARGGEESKFWGCVRWKPGAPAASAAAEASHRCLGTRPFKEE